MRKGKDGYWYPEPGDSEKIFGPGSYIDWENNTVYAADGKVYRGVQVNMEDIKRMIEAALKDR